MRTFRSHGLLRHNRQKDSIHLLYALHRSCIRLSDILQAPRRHTISSICSSMDLLRLTFSLHLRRFSVAPGSVLCSCSSQATFLLYPQEYHTDRKESCLCGCIFSSHLFAPCIYASSSGCNRNLVDFLKCQYSICNPGRNTRHSRQCLAP